MKVKRIGFKNFRNLEDCELFPCDGVNVIYGDNAQGKTNIIEALWLFCGGHSFRTARDSEVIQWGKDFARLEMNFFGQEREQNAVLTFLNGKKTVTVNGVEKSSASALIEKFCAVAFSPEHLNLIKRGPGERRRFIDSAICREKLQNAVILSKYNRMLTQRNALLKDIARKPYLEDTLDIWDRQLVTHGAMLIRKRLDYMQMLSEKAAAFHSGISKGREELKIRYLATEDIQPEDDLDTIRPHQRQERQVLCLAGTAAQRRALAQAGGSRRAQGAHGRGAGDFARRRSLGAGQQPAGLSSQRAEALPGIHYLLRRIQQGAAQGRKGLFRSKGENQFLILNS